jgi:hypothetical protein
VSDGDEVRGGAADAAADRPPRPGARAVAPADVGGLGTEAAGQRHWKFMRLGYRSPTSGREGCNFVVGAVQARRGGKIDGCVAADSGFPDRSEAVGVGRGGSGARDVEIAVLRHQLAVLRRQVARPRYNPTDRMLLAVLARLLPRDRWRVFMVTPATLLRWDRALVARPWTYPLTGSGRRGLPEATVDLVVRLARENPRWGYLRIVGEARKLGVMVSATSVRAILRRHGLGPAPRRSGPSWSSCAARLRERRRRASSRWRRSR